MIIFYENIVLRKIESLRSHIRTYLFGIGKLLIKQEYRKSERYTDIENESGEPLPFEGFVSDNLCDS